MRRPRVGGVGLGARSRRCSTSARRCPRGARPPRRRRAGRRPRGSARRRAGRAPRRTWPAPACRRSATRAAPVGRLDRGEDRARAGPRAVGHRERPVAGDADQLGAAQHGLRRDPQLAVVERRRAPPTTTMSARVANSVLFTIRSPASATWSTSACEPITNAAPPVARSASTNWSAAPHGDDLVDARLEAEPPELAHELLRRVADVVGQEARSPCPPRAARRPRRPRRRGRSSPTQRQPSRSSSTWS